MRLPRVVESRRRRVDYEEEYRIVKANGVVVTFPRHKPLPLSNSGPSRVPAARLYAKQHGLKVWDCDDMCKARGEPTFEERKAKKLEEARAHKRYLRLDPSEAETGVEPEVKITPRHPYPYLTVATYAAKKTGGNRRCIVFKRFYQDPNLSAASVATASAGDKDVEVGGRNLLKRPREDLGNSS